ncbi:hypothetical protein PM082_021620 [Marasmius tenuissimus]|nr:hypothetical protein PM082_021620 [Marasmius tenuissimus]
MSTLDNLSAELLAEIFRLIHDNSRHTIFTLLRVNKFISGAALPFAYRELFFDFDQTRVPPHRNPRLQTEADLEPYTQSLQNLNSLLQLPSESAIWKGIRKVAVRSKVVIWPGEDPDARWPRQNDAPTEPPFIPSEEAVQARWSSFIELISCLANPREVVFDCAERVPIILLGSLEASHPFCRLHVKNWTRLRSDVRVGDPYEEALGQSPCLRSLQANFVYGELGMDYNYVAFQRILALSPSLEEIAYSRRVSRDHVMHDLSLHEKAEEERERKRFRVGKPVRKANIRSIRWGSLNPILLEGWRSFIDLPKVETLEMDGAHEVDWMSYAMDHSTFSGIKHLSFKVDYYSRDSQREFKSTLEDFLISLSPLESLSVVQYYDYIDLPLILLHHGPSLHSLSLHQVENRLELRPTLTLDDLNSILSNTPHLENFEFDLNRTGNPQENEMKTYEVVSSFRLLRSVTIHYDLGIHHEAFDGYFSFDTYFDNSGQQNPEQQISFEIAKYGGIYTTIDDRFAREVWQTMGTSQLDRVVLYVGESNREVGFGLPALWIMREKTNSKCIRLSRNERDDLRDDISALQVVED